MRRSRLPLAAAAVAVAVLTGCGGDAGYPDATAATVQSRVSRVLEAANDRDWAGARTALGALRSDVSAAQRLGQLSGERAAQILAVADDVEAGLPAPSRAPAPRPSPSPTRAAPRPAAPPPAPEPRKDEKEEDKKGEDKDEGKDDGD